MTTAQILVTNPTSGQTGVAISTYATIEEVWDGVIGGAGLEGGPAHMPSRTGAEFFAYDVGPRRFSIGVTTQSADADTGLANLRDLGKLLWSPRQPLTLERVTTPGGVTTNHIAEAVLTDGGWSPEASDLINVRHVIGFLLLPGYWRDKNATSNGITTGTNVSVGGVDYTQWLTVTLTNGTSPTLTNNTTGAVLTYTGNPGASGVVIDARAFTAVQGGSTDVRANVSSNGAWWMELAPGTNNLTLTGGGTCSISWRGVWL